MAQLGKYLKKYGITIVLLILLFLLVCSNVVIIDDDSQNTNPISINLAKLNDKPLHHRNPNAIQSEKSKPPKPNAPNTIWVSMSVCFSKTTDFHGKSGYPYATVTPLAVLLWKHFTDVKVLVQVVHQIQDNQTYLLSEYVKSLESCGAIVKLVMSTDSGIDCVRMSQLSRMVAYVYPEIEEDDVYVTMDVNAFVMTSTILEPIYKYPHMTTWIFQYEDTADNELGTGMTFSQCLIGLRARDWKRILEYQGLDPSKDLSAWVKVKEGEFELFRKEAWYYDQWITTLSILKHRACNVPEKSGLWRNEGVEFDPEFDDTDVCFHGFGYSDCNKDIMIVYQGCKWWHFFPDQTFEEHVEKFNQLTNFTFNLQMQNPFQDEDE